MVPNVIDLAKQSSFLKRDNFIWGKGTKFDKGSGEVNGSAHDCDRISLNNPSSSKFLAILRGVWMGQKTFFAFFENGL